MSFALVEVEDLELELAHHLWIVVPVATGSGHRFLYGRNVFVLWSDLADGVSPGHSVVAIKIVIFGLVARIFLLVLVAADFLHLLPIFAAGRRLIEFYSLPSWARLGGFLGAVVMQRIACGFGVSAEVLSLRYRGVGDEEMAVVANLVVDLVVLSGFVTKLKLARQAREVSLLLA